MDIFKKILHILSSPKIFFFILLWLIFLLVSGTIAQKDMGLYAAQEKYFSSFIIWVGDFIPLPGGYLTLSIIFFSLFSKLILEKWTKAKTGTIIIHIGALLLLFGGFITSEFSSEGNMVIDEGGTTNHVSDYHQRELVFRSQGEGDKITEITFSNKYLKKGEILEDIDLPFKIKIIDFCRNCQLVKKPEVSTDKKLHGMLKLFNMEKAPLLKEDELNISGINMLISGTGLEIDGLYAIFENMPIQRVLDINGKKYAVEIRRKRTYLPFSIKLLDFEKQMHPATNKPKSYQSEVILEDGDLNWRSLIEMNQPLRYKGYTFYQSSFIENGNAQTTVLAVVKNYGRIFPYISSIIICIGLLVHLFQRLPILMRKNPK